VHDHVSPRPVIALQAPRVTLVPRHFDFGAKIALSYLLLSVLWIIGSDRAVDWMLPDSEFATWAQSVKGLVFVTLSAVVLYLAVHLYIKRLAQANEDLQVAWEESLLGWAMAMDAREPDMAQHSQRVASLTVMLARFMGVDDQDLPAVYRGALLHDIGKISVPDAVLQFPGPLDEEQWALMRKHPETARRILEPIEFLQDAIDIPYCHHERWDGTGYPRGLAGTDIPLWARIFAIVDVYDALSSKRVYRVAMPTSAVLDHIKSGSGSHFDPDVVAAFCRLIGQLQVQVR